MNAADFNVRLYTFQKKKENNRKSYTSSNNALKRG